MTEAPWKVPLSDLLVSEQMVQAVAETVASGWWSMGPRVGEFERAYAEFLGCRHAIAVANGTAALHLALLAVGCGRGDEVVLPSLNFVAAANAVAHTGATPVFCDVVGEDDLNLDPGDLEAALSPATKAVIALHYAGFPCDVEAVKRICADRGIALIEDAAHAPGSRVSRVNGRMCGTVGSAGCFSFFSNKNLPVGEGGMVVTDDDALADSLRLLRSHGMTTLTWDRHRGHAHSYDVVAQGFNYRLDELRSAMGVVQLGRLPDDNAARARLSARYRDALDGGNGSLRMPFADRLGDEAYAHHLAVALVPEGTVRDDVRTRLAEARIQTSVHYPPIHRFSQYKEIGERRPLPRTDAVASRLLTLPLYAHMTDEQADYVVESLVAAVRD
jgi:dTDP-4-amino-4,6-dideoxygalactose transaminase